MKTALVFVKMSMIVKNLFDRTTGDELQSIKDHFVDAYSDAQLCALVLVSMVLRVFGLTPEPEDGTRSVLFVAGMLVKFLKNLQYGPEVFRAGPNPLDQLVDHGMQEFLHEA
ncbi:MAG: hypothetical protein PVH19_00080 [Planctomycetia bacterium]|jgi:hypothetical protein